LPVEEFVGTSWAELINAVNVWPRAAETRTAKQRAIAKSLTKRCIETSAPWCEIGFFELLNVARFDPIVNNYFWRR